MAQFANSTFSHASYALFRPTYHSDLYKTILDFHKGSKDLCVDLGSGHGLVVRALSPYFRKVIGTDPSQGMVEQAVKSTPIDDYPNVSYYSASAEHLASLEDGTIDMVVAGQAAHWFEPSKTWSEMKRVLRSEGTLAFWGYTDPTFPGFPSATRILGDYAYENDPDALGPYWSQPGRTRVQDKLRHLQPPSLDWVDIRRLEYEPDIHVPKQGRGSMFLSATLSIANCMDYVRTWSSFSAWQEKHPNQIREDKCGVGDVVDQAFMAMRNAEPSWQTEDWLDKSIEVEWGTGLLLARRR